MKFKIKFHLVNFKKETLTRRIHTFSKEIYFVCQDTVLSLLPICELLIEMVRQMAERCPYVSVPISNPLALHSTESQGQHTDC